MDLGVQALLPAAVRTVDYCKVRPDERVVVYTDSRRSPAPAEAFYAACVARGFDVILVRGLEQRVGEDPPRSAVAAMRDADIVFDLASVCWSDYAPAINEILTSGTRVLMVHVPDQSFVDRPPDPDVLWRVDVSEELFAHSTEMHVTSPEGTDLWAHLREGVLDPGRGFVWKPGQWDSYGVINISTASHIEEEMRGTVYFNGPMIMLPEYEFVTSRPIKVQIEAGRIVEIEADHPEAQLFTRWMKAWDDEGVYMISHLGFGLDPRARVDIHDEGGWESINGAVVLGFGTKTTAMADEVRQSRGHLDAVVLGTTIVMDGRTIVEEGSFTEESGLGSGGR